MKTVLFLCTGNFYRSRFAEAVFNHHASLEGLDYKAYSRGLGVHLVTSPLLLAQETADALTVLGIDLKHTGPNYIQVEENDFVQSDLVIALARSEHEAYMDRLYPKRANQIEYWEVQDLEFIDSSIALPAIEKNVLALIRQLKSQRSQVDLVQQ